MPRAIDQTGAKPVSSEAEWLIDDSTKDLYLSLVDADKPKSPDLPAGREPTRSPSKAPAQEPPKPRKTEPKSAPQIGLSDGPESSSRFLAYGAIVVVLAVLAYEGLVHGVGSRSQTKRLRHTPTDSESAARGSAKTANVAEAQAPSASLEAALGQAGPGSLSMVPGFILATVAPKQSVTYTLVINNLTTHELTFEAEGQDLVLKDGKPVYQAANETPDSVAGSLLFSKKSINVKAGQSASFDLTLTLPDQTQVRGVLVLLKGSDQISQGRGTVMTPSLGTFISLARPEDPSVTSGSSSTAVPVRFEVSQWQTDSTAKCSDAGPSTSTSLQATAAAIASASSSSGGQHP